MMWQRFTERARKVIFYAQEEAQRMGESQVSTEHLLLGLIRETDSVAARILDRLGINLQRIRAEVERSAPRGNARPGQEMQLTARAKRVIDLAYDEARQLNNNYVGTEHLLLGLMREGEGLAARVLHKLGADLERARLVVRQIQDAEPSMPSSPSTAAPARHFAMPTLETLGIDLTQQARQGRLTPVLERDAEIGQLLQILAKQSHHNPLLIGPRGVGKTALVHGAAIILTHGEVPPVLKNKRMIALTPESLLLQISATYMVERLLREIRRAQNELILFIDNLENLFEPSLGTRNIDGLQLLRFLLHSSEVRCIGVFNTGGANDEESLSRLALLFQPVSIEELSPEATLRVLVALQPHYQLLYGVSITDEAIEAAVNLAVRYLPEQRLPAKAFELLESAAAMLALESPRLPLALYQKLSEDELLRLLIDAIRVRDPVPEQLSELEAERQRVQESLQQLLAQFQQREQAPSLPTLTAQHIAQAVHTRTGIPIDQLLEDSP